MNRITRIDEDVAVNPYPPNPLSPFTEKGGGSHMRMFPLSTREEGARGRGLASSTLMPEGRAEKLPYPTPSRLRPFAPLR
jgi:hypothetical protein